MVKIVDLRQDCRLIRANFEGYKLSLEPVPILRKEHENIPYNASPSEQQYSLLHAELFSLQNLLHVDPWARTQAYFISTNNEVMRTAYNESTGVAEKVQSVYRISAIENRIVGDYNYSMRFLSEKYCVLCDGIKTVLLLDTGDRMRAPEWKDVARAKVSTGADDEERNFLIYDARLDMVQEQKQISLALGRVQRTEASSDTGSIHILRLYWARWNYDNAWNFSIVDCLEGKGTVHYCAFEPRADSLILCSNREFEFLSKKQEAIATGTSCLEPMLIEEKKPQLHDGLEITGFTWSQTDEDIQIRFDAQKDGKDKTDYLIQCSKDKLIVKCVEKTILDALLFDLVDKDLTTWRFENNCLQITLVKETRALLWPSLLPSVGACLPMEQKPVANLEAPVEDCDFPLDMMEDDVKINRFHFPTKNITHTVLLGANTPLFSTNLRAGFPLAIATRQDVDACVWLQNYNPSKPGEWSLRHEGNLDAFGYIQASKREKKFMECTPDLRYAVICEAHRHIFLYKTTHDTASGLHNRRGPQIALGKQHLIALEESAGEVLGVATACSVITILTKNCVLHLQIQ